MATTNAPSGYGALRQDISAAAYRGKRLRFSAYLKTRGIRKQTGLLLTLIEPDAMKIWAMQKRPILGTTGWKRYVYVVDVPADTRAIMFGVSIQGGGKVWASDFRFEVVGKGVALTHDAPQIRSSN